MTMPTVKNRLSLTEVGEELLVYEWATERAICLGPIGKIALKACVNQQDWDAALAQVAELNLQDPQAALEEALNSLAEQDLILPEKPCQFDRRRFLQVAGALASLPVVASVLAPQPVQALSCKLCDVDINNIPTDCSTCGLICKNSAGATCTTPAGGTLRICCFEYVLNITLNGGSPSGVCGPAGFGDNNNEATGEYRCRTLFPAFQAFNTDCRTARDAAIALGGTDTSLYYCCQCIGHAPRPDQFTC